MSVSVKDSDVIVLLLVCYYILVPRCISIIYTIENISRSHAFYWCS